MISRFARVGSLFTFSLVAVTALGCGRSAIVDADGLPLQRVVVYRNGVAYFERGGHVEKSEVEFKMKESEVGDFLATLAVIERGGSSVRSAAFPLEVAEAEEDKTPPAKKTEDEKKGLKKVVLALDGKAHDLEVGYVAASPVWRPSYRLVVEQAGQAYVQAWGIVQNLSGEDWKNVKLTLVAGAPLSFDPQLGLPVIPDRPIVTDHGEVIAAVPHGDTSLREKADGNVAADAPPPPEPPRNMPADEEDEPSPDKAEATTTKDLKKRGPSGNKKRPAAEAAAGKAESERRPSPSRAQTQPPPPPPPPPKTITPRNVRSLAAVAVEAGATRYDLPQPVTVPDHSATMVLLLSQRVPGEALFLFAPDGGVPDSSSHPFRVARFVNKTAGVLERGPIAVFEQGSFLGQGMLDPLPSGATATVPFALERALAVDLDTKTDELGERIAKIENGELTIERDSVRYTKYRLRNGGDTEAKMLVRHPRIPGARLAKPPVGTEDNVGTQTALVPAVVKAGATAELVVDERTTVNRREDWFSLIAENAIKGYLADRRADPKVSAKLTTVLGARKEIVDRLEARTKLVQEQSTLQQQTQETRNNLRAIEKNKTADQLRVKLTARLAETATRLDEITKRIVELDAKLAELRIQFKETLRDLLVTAPLPPI